MRYWINEGKNGITEWKLHNACSETIVLQKECKDGWKRQIAFKKSELGVNFFETKEECLEKTKHSENN